MSIVEKALSKLQETGKPSERRQAEVSVRSSPARPVVTDAHVSDNALVTDNRITVNFDAFQQAGILPERSDALAVRHQFRRLKWPILDEVSARRREGQPCAGAVMIASAVPGEGKTFTSFNLALSIAREEDKRVILIDCDIAKSQLTDVLGLSDKPGLTEFLLRPELAIADVLNATDVDRLYVIPAGKAVPHAAELLSSARMDQLLRELTGAGPGVVALLDSSPILATNEAQVLARLVPQIVLIVRAEKTPQPTVLEACDIVGREKTSAVLNQAHLWLNAESHGAAYGYYNNDQREQ